MVGNPVRDGFIQLTHGEGEVGGEAVALSGAPRIAYKRFDEKPIELEAADEAAENHAGTHKWE